MSEMKTWVTPRATVQKFVPNDHVTMCYAAKLSLECAIPGESANEIDDYSDENNAATGSDGLWHGTCGTDPGVFDMAGNVGYEYVNGVIDYTRPIKGVQIGSVYDPNTSLSSNIGAVQTNQSLWEAYDAGNDEFRASWISTNDNWATTYVHYGVATILQMLKGGSANWSG